MLDHRKRTIQTYVLYLCFYTTVKDGGARASLTALSHFFAQRRVSWSRKTHPDHILDKLLKGYKAKKPSTTYKRKPLCLELLRKFFATVDYNEYDHFLNWTVLLTAYYFGLRVGEYAVKKYEEEVAHILHVGDYSCSGKGGPRNGQVTLNVHGHKGDRFGARDAHVPVACNGDCTGDEDMFCPVHVLRRYVEWRNLKFGDKGPLFVQSNGKPLRQEHVSWLVRTNITRIGLNPKDYSPHCLRSGRATDLARAGVLSRDIKKWGRWLSDCWETYYLKLDLSDIAKATQISLQDLRLANTNPSRNKSRGSTMVSKSCASKECVSRSDVTKMVKELLDEALTVNKRNSTTKPTISRSVSAPSSTLLLPCLATPPMEAATPNDLSMFQHVHERTEERRILRRNTVVRRRKDGDKQRPKKRRRVTKTKKRNKRNSYKYNEFVVADDSV